MAGKHVLLIEDEPHIAEAIRFILSRAGWQVTLHDDGQDAVSVISDKQPDVLVLDMMLPGRSGLEILADLRGGDSAQKTLPVLMLTARGQLRDREAAERAGATAFLAKPFANADVLAAVSKLADDEAG
jgi:DNA-binding response OmpR family regulator